MCVDRAGDLRGPSTAHAVCRQQGPPAHPGRERPSVQGGCHSRDPNARSRSVLLPLPWRSRRGSRRGAAGRRGDDPVMPHGRGEWNRQDVGCGRRPRDDAARWVTIVGGNSRTRQCFYARGFPRSIQGERAVGSVRLETVEAWLRGTAPELAIERLLKDDEEPVDVADPRSPFSPRVRHLGGRSAPASMPASDTTTRWSGFPVPSVCRSVERRVLLYVDEMGPRPTTSFTKRPARHAQLHTLPATLTSCSHAKIGSSATLKAVGR